MLLVNTHADFKQAIVGSRNVEDGTLEFKIMSKNELRTFASP
jgi:hypothetical protein